MLLLYCVMPSCVFAVGSDDSRVTYPAQQLSNEKLQDIAERFCADIIGLKNASISFSNFPAKTSDCIGIDVTMETEPFSCQIEMDKYSGQVKKYKIMGLKPEYIDEDEKTLSSNEAFVAVKPILSYFEQPLEQADYTIKDSISGTSWSISRVFEHLGVPYLGARIYISISKKTGLIRKFHYNPIVNFPSPPEKEITKAEALKIAQREVPKMVFKTNLYQFGTSKHKMEVLAGTDDILKVILEVDESNYSSQYPFITVGTGSPRYCWAILVQKSWKHDWSSSWASGPGRFLFVDIETAEIIEYSTLTSPTWKSIIKKQYPIGILMIIILASCCHLIAKTYKWIRKIYQEKGEHTIES